MQNFYSSKIFFEFEHDFRMIKSSFEACPMHYHDFIEIAYIVSGRAVHIIDNMKFEIKKGDLFIINPNTPHAIMPPENRSKNEDDFVLYNWIFLPSFIDKELAENDNFVLSAQNFFFDKILSENVKYIFIPSDKTFNLENLIDDIYREYTIKADGYKTIIKSQLTTMIIKIFRKYREEISDDQSFSSVQNAIIEQVIKYIDSHFCENITLDELAKRAYLSPAYFSKKFKDITNKTITEFIRCKRICKAKQLLNTTSLSINEIAQSVGYLDASFFYETFKKEVGMSPKKFRTSETK